MKGNLYMKKYFYFTLMIVLILIMTAGCSFSLSATDDTSETTDADQVNLYVMHGRQEAPEAYTKLGDAFHKKYPNITVHYETPSNFDLTMQNRRAQNRTPDIYSATTIEANAGILMDLTDEPFMKNVKKVTFDTVKDKRDYFFPIGYSGVGVIYNKTVFRENSLTPPKTLSELTKVHQVLASKNIAAFALGYKDLWVGHFSLRPAFYAVYGTYPDWNQKRSKGEVSFSDTPQWQLIADIPKNYVYAYGNTDTAFEVGYMDACSMLANGDAAMMLQGSWATSLIQTYNKDVELGFIPLPVSDDPERSKISYYCDYYLSISADTKHPKEAKLYLDFLSTQEAAEIYVDSTKTFSSVIGAPIPEDTVSKDIEKYVDKNQYIDDPSGTWPNRFYKNAEKYFMEYILDGINYKELTNLLDEEWDTCSDK